MPAPRGLDHLGDPVGVPPRFGSREALSGRSGGTCPGAAQTGPVQAPNACAFGRRSYGRRVGPTSRPADTNLVDNTEVCRAIFEAASLAILIADAQGRYLEANPMACRL